MQFFHTAEANHNLIDKIIEQLEREPKSYSQADWGINSCSTPCCLAGHAVRIATPDVTPTRNFFQWQKNAQHLLGISDLLAAYLFGPQWDREWTQLSGRSSPSPQDAIWVLERIKEGFLPIPGSDS